MAETLKNRENKTFSENNNEPNKEDKVWVIRVYNDGVTIEDNGDPEKMREINEKYLQQKEERLHLIDSTGVKGAIVGAEYVLGIVLPLVFGMNLIEALQFTRKVMSEGDAIAKVYSNQCDAMEDFYKIADLNKEYNEKLFVTVEELEGMED